MKIRAFNLTILITTLFVCSGLQAKSGSLLAIDKAGDTIHDKSKKELREQEKHKLKHSHKRAFIKAGAVYAKLNTTASFALPNNLLSASLSLEDNLGLQDKSYFFTGSLM